MRKKIISLTCALAMLLTMFTAFANVSAAGEQTISTKAALAKDGTATITVSYSGLNPVKGLNFVLPLNTEVFDLSSFDVYTAAAMTEKFSNGMATYADNKISFAWTATNIANPATLAPGDADVMTVTVPVKDRTKLPLDKIDITAVSISSTNGEGANTAYGTADQNPDAAITVDAGSLVDPNAPTPKPTAPARPTQMPAPTVDPNAPTQRPIITTGQRIGGEGVVENGTAKITVSYAGLNPVKGLNFVLPLDADVFDLSSFDVYTAAAMTEKFSNGMATYADNKISFAWTATNIANPATLAAGDADVMTVTVPVKDASKLPKEILLTAVSISSTNGEGANTAYGTADQNPDVEIGLNAIKVAEKAGPVSTPKVVKTANLKDHVAKADSGTNKSLADLVAEAKAAGKTVYLGTQVKKGDEVVTTYGPSTYEVMYKGKILTEKEKSDIENGYDTSVDIVDYINNAVYYIYDSAITKLSTHPSAVDGSGNAETLIDPVDKTIGGKEPTDSKPSLSVSPKSGSVAQNKTVTVKPNANVNGGSDAKLVVTLGAGSLDAVAGSGVSVVGADKTVKEKLVEGTETEIALDDTIQFTAAVKDKKVVLDFKLTCKTPLGNDGEATAKVTYTVKADDKKGGSSSDDDDDKNTNGPIAGPAGSDLGGNVMNMTSFTDLGNVGWAQAAINSLSQLGIISGRDTTTFDPDANITRAEYCQILVGAIGKTQEAADSSFADVPSDAWFYHAVSVANAYGIVSGYGDGNFGPYDLITRQDMALMTYKAAQAMSKDLSAQRVLNFNDAGSIADYASEAVTTLANAGIINGVSDTEFAPRNNATRAQAAVILYQTFVKANN